MVRRSCMFCEKLYEQDMLRYVSISKPHNAILITLMMVSSSADLEQMKSIYEKISSKKHMCHSHYVDAAKYLAAEMAAVGTRFSYYNDPTAVGSTAYVNEAEIPLHVLDLLNEYMKNIDSTVVITERDICQFMNDALRRYYTQNGWNTVSQIDEKMDYEEEMNETSASELMEQQGPGFPSSSDNPAPECVMLDDADDKEALHQSLRANEPIHTLADAIKQETEKYDDSGYGAMRQPKVECEEAPEPQPLSTETACPIVMDVKPENDNLFVKKDIDNSEVMVVDAESEPMQCSPEDPSAESSSVPVPELDATDPLLLKQYFLIEGEMLTKLFKFCPECGKQLAKSRLCPVGTAAVMRYVCATCSLRYPHVRRWESQRRAVEHKKEKAYKGDLEAAVAAITTGLRYTELQRWAEQLNLSFFTKAFFWKVFQWTKTAVDQVYDAHQKDVMKIVRKSYERNERMRLAVDVHVIKKGSPPLVAMSVLSDTRMKLILHTVFIHHSETANIDGRVDVEALNRHLQWMSKETLPVYSLVTNRNPALAAPVKEFEPKLGPIRHLYDTSLMVNWLETELRKVAQREGCSSILPCIEKVKTILWSAVEFSPEFSSQVPHRFNACLGYVRDPKEYSPTSSSANSSTANGHTEKANVPRLEGDAFKNFRDVVLNKRFQRDLLKASPAGDGVPLRQFQNALYKIYCRKDIDYPITVYPVFMKMAEMHINTLRLAELSGARKVERVEERDGPRGKTLVKFKTPVIHSWRDNVLQKVLAHRARMLRDDVDDIDENSQELIEAIEAEDAYDDLA